MLCFRKFLVAKKFMDKGGGGGGGGGREGVSRFSVNFFCLRVLRRGTLFCVTNAGIEKFQASEGYVTIFRRFFFVSQYQKNFQGKPSVLCF